MPNTTKVLAENICRVREQISAAAKVSGRSADDITLVAVTKYVDADMTRQVAEAGCRVLGENRPQAFWAKADSLAEFQSKFGFQWHMIGHLQRNKVARTLPLASLLHSIDSARLIAEVDKAAGTANLIANVLLEVNISGDEAKHGWPPAEMSAVLESVAKFPNVRVKGLMAMAGLQTDGQGARREFAAMTELRQSLMSKCPDNCEMLELSMGMSRDFPEAIEEGATIVRIGSTLFDGIR